MRIRTYQLALVLAAASFGVPFMAVRVGASTNHASAVHPRGETIPGQATVNSPDATPTGLQLHRYDVEASGTNGSGASCSTPDDHSADPVTQVIGALDTDLVSEEDFGTGTQCSGSSKLYYWWADYYDSMGNQHLLRTLGITGGDVHTFYLWQNSSYVWDYQIDSTNWKTYTNGDQGAFAMTQGLFTFDGGTSVNIAFEMWDMHHQNNYGSWSTTWDTAAKTDTGDPVCLYNDGTDNDPWYAAEFPTGSDCQNS